MIRLAAVALAATQAVNLARPAAGVLAYLLTKASIEDQRQAIHAALEAP